MKLLTKVITMPKYAVIVSLISSLKLEIEAESEEAATDDAYERVINTDAGLLADDVQIIDSWPVS